MKHTNNNNFPFIGCKNNKNGRSCSDEKFFIFELSNYVSPMDYWHNIICIA